MKNALECSQQGLLFAEKTGNLTVQSLLLNELAIVQHVQGQHHTALTTFQHSQLVAKAAGDLYREARSIYLQGNVYRSLGYYQHASSMYKEAEVLCTALGLDSDSQFHGNLLDQKAELLLLKTEYDDCQKLQKILLEKQVKANWPADDIHRKMRYL